MSGRPASGAGAIATPWAKGSTLCSTLEFVRERFGGTVLRQVLQQVPVKERTRVAATEPTGEIPYALLLTLWRAADEVLSALDARWIEESGAYSIDSLGVQLYGGILRKPTPTEFLTQSISLFRLYYHPGDMEVVEEQPGRAVLRLVGFDAADALFCRRQTGGLAKAVSLAGGQSPAVRHVRCAHEGDAFCEWQLKWQGGEGRE